MKIAILGTRGIPARFGGFETFAEEFSVRAAEQGHEMTLFCEDGGQLHLSSYKGVNLYYTKTVNIPGLRSFYADLVGILKTLRGYDVVYMLGYHTAFLNILPRLLGTNFWVNMDGLEWKRSKWSPPVQFYLRAMESLAIVTASRVVIDAQALEPELRCRYKGTKPMTYLPYGAHIVESPPQSGILSLLKLSPSEYYLVVCRLEPENLVLEMIDGFLETQTTRKMVIVGDIDAGTSYTRLLKQRVDDRLLYAGTVFDSGELAHLRFNAFVYCHGHSVGGSNPSLLEAMACGNTVVAHDNVFNREVLADQGHFFADSKAFSRIISRLEEDGSEENVGQAYQNRIRSVYNWNKVTQQYLELMKNGGRTRQ